MDVDEDEDTINLDEFDLHGFTQEEIRAYNAMAEPGQRLQDAVLPKKVAPSLQDISGKLLDYQLYTGFILICIQTD